MLNVTLIRSEDTLKPIIYTRLLGLYDMGVRVIISDDIQSELWYILCDFVNVCVCRHLKLVHPVHNMLSLALGLHSGVILLMCNYTEQ